VYQALKKANKKNKNKNVLEISKQIESNFAVNAKEN